MAGELVVADKQIQLRDWVGGPGTWVDWIDQVPDWWGGAGVRTFDTPRASTHGVRGGRDLYGSKAMTARMFITAPDQATLLQRIDATAAAFALVSDDSNIPIVAQFLGTKRRRYGKPRRFEVDSQLATYFEAFGMFGVVIHWQFEALDPFVYSDVLHSLGLNLPSPSVGFSVPFTVPFTVPASTSTGIGAAPNLGTAPAAWTARLDGPLTNPTITHTESGEAIKLTANGGLVIATGEYVLIDSDAKSILANGVGDRRAFLNLASKWFMLDPTPATNSIAFAADAGSGSLTFNWRDTYQP